jgi:hypothetical protein
LLVTRSANSEIYPNPINCGFDDRLDQLPLSLDFHPVLYELPLHGDISQVDYVATKPIKRGYKPAS